MRREEIVLSDSTAKMIVDGRTVASLRCEDIVKFFIVRYENAFFHGDEPFYVAVFPDCLWVIPYATLGILDFLDRIAQPLERSGSIFRALSPPRPFVWRRRYLGVLPIFPIPRLACHPLSTLPSWIEEGPFKPSELPEFTEDLSHG